MGVTVRALQTVGVIGVLMNSRCHQFTLLVLLMSLTGWAGGLEQRVNGGIVLKDRRRWRQLGIFKRMSLTAVNDVFFY